MQTKNIDDVYEKLLSEGMKPGTPLNMPSHSVWVKDKGEWKLHSGRDGNVGFNRFRYMPQYENAMLTENGKTPDDVIPGMSDYDLFKAINYAPSDLGRPNYTEGEEEQIWNELNKYFDLPKYEQNKYGFRVNDKDKKVSLGTRGIQDGRGFGGWQVKPQDLGELKRRK